ncbi:hypothetical protein LSH36_398g02027 [Paralvinella palmiformis]|uniref:Glutaredoxin domain-containing protein n=1 Tax=Paralvinella palmiformis TaxID=53620 RepID=A0AAD9N1C8_9ANNE|nr:hypothetical protein LSH36_398g02027 [Paralvinella palmiformis]
MAGAQPFIDAKIRQRTVLMFTKKSCPDSKLARSILDDYNMRPDVYECCDIDSRQDCTQLENYLQVLCLTDTRSVPQLFVRGKYIGGEKEIPRYHESGELKRILSVAKAF